MSRVIQQPAAGEYRPLPRRKRNVADKFETFRGVSNAYGLGRLDGRVRSLDDQLIAEFDPLQVRRLGERQRQYGEVDQVGLVDSLDGPGDHHAHAEVHRAKRRMLAAGALPVAFPRNDHAGLALFLGRQRPLGKRRPALVIETLEDKLRNLFHEYYLYTIDDLVKLTGSDGLYVYSKISDLQHKKRSGIRGRLELKRVVSDDGKKRIGRLSSTELYVSLNEYLKEIDENG